MRRLLYIGQVVVAAIMALSALMGLAIVFLGDFGGPSQTRFSMADELRLIGLFVAPVLMVVAVLAQRATAQGTTERRVAVALAAATVLGWGLLVLSMLD